LQHVAIKTKIIFTNNPSSNKTLKLDIIFFFYNSQFREKKQKKPIIVISG